MENRTRHYVKKLKFAPISILAALLFAAACSLVHKRVETEKLLTPLATANTSDLISTVNKLVGVRSIHGRVDIQFEDTSFATSGIAEKYRTVEGSIYLQRPGKVSHRDSQRRRKVSQVCEGHEQRRLWEAGHGRNFEAGR